MSLLDALRLTLPASAPARPAPPPLTDQDFAADTRRRPAADREARERGTQRVAEWLKQGEAEPGSGPKPGLIDKAVDKALDNANERLELLLALDIPRFAKEYADDTPETRFFADLASATKKADEIVGYIAKVAGRAEKFGGLAGIDAVRGAGKDLGAVAKGVSGGLKTAKDGFDQARKIAAWAESLQQFADASSAWEPGDRQGVGQWIDALEKLWDHTAPFVEWLDSKALKALLQGAGFAGEAMPAIRIVTAYGFIGIHALRAGVNNVNAYFDTLNRRLAEIDRDARGAPAEAELPAPPEPWKSREELAAEAEALEKFRIKEALYARQRAAQRRQQDRRDAVAAAFRAKEFVAVYLRERPALCRALRGLLVDDPQAVDWWHCLVLDTAADTEPDPETGEQPAIENISAEEAAGEIERFAAFSPPCPPYDAVWQKALAAHLAERGKIKAK